MFVAWLILQKPLQAIEPFRGFPVLDGSSIFQKCGASWTSTSATINLAFETMSKRRKGFPSETNVKRGNRIVHGDKEFVEKVGRNDLCPCRSGKLFKKCCRNKGCFRW